MGKNWDQLWIFTFYPLDRDPARQRPPRQRRLPPDRHLLDRDPPVCGKEQAVCILLECIIAL